MVPGLGHHLVLNQQGATGFDDERANVLGLEPVSEPGIDIASRPAVHGYARLVAAEAEPTAMREGDMPDRRRLDADALLSSDETEALLALLSDVSQGHGDDLGVREAARAGWTLLSSRATTQGGYGAARDDGDYQRLLRRMQNRDRPWRAGQ